VAAQETSQRPGPSVALLPIAASVVAVLGLADAMYLTIHHYTAAPVPCGEGFDCEMVLNSSWGEIGGVPLAAFGAGAYFVAFSLALLTAFGDRRMWKLFGILTTLMAAFSLFLIYVQAFRIHAFCQYCLLSAGTTFTLFIIYLISMFLKPRAGA
jgi:uncharacterized membrane protein